MYLPYELVGLNRKALAKEFRNINDKSIIVWKFEFEQVLVPSNKTKDIWK